LFSIGLPSGFAAWCDATLVGLAERAFGTVELAAINTLEELAVAALRTDAMRLVASSRAPVVRLQTEIVRVDKPLLVALGNPLEALRGLMEDAGQDVVTATRTVASSCATMLTLRMAPRALVLSSEDEIDPLALAIAIARHFELRLRDSDIAQIVGGRPPTGVEADRDELSTWWDRLSEREQAIVNGALQPYVAHFSGGELEPLIWEPGLFLVPADGEMGPGPADAPIDVTGRARFLVHGPYINLPPGSWSANVVLGFSAETAGMTFIVDVAAGMQLASTRIESTGEQVMEVNLAFEIQEATTAAIEIRVVIERAAFDGRLALGYATLIRRTTVRGDVRDYLTETLRKYP